MDDRPVATAPSATRGPSRPARGPAPAKLDNRQRDELLGAVAGGKGIDQALRAMKLSFRAYRNTIGQDPEFRDEVASARRAADESLDEIGRLLAIDDTEVLFKLWDRRDRARFLGIARKDRAKERAEDRVERRIDRAVQLRLVEMAAEARAHERAAPPDAEPGALDFSRLSGEELARFRALAAKARGEAGPGE